MYRRLVLLALLISLLVVVRPASAQASGPVYVVQPDDTLYSIAARFNVTMNELAAANGISLDSVLAVGQQLVIPGLPGISGVLDTEVVNLGDSLQSVVRRTQIPLDLLRRLNHVVSPTEFYVGASLIVPKQENQVDLTNRFSAAAGQSLLELAAETQSNPWTLAALNGLDGTWDALPGDVLYAPGQGTPGQNAGGLPSAFVNVQITSLPLKQGMTGEIVVQPAQGATITGMLVTYPLHFFPLGDGRVVALQGIHAMLTPGIYPLQLTATSADGSTQSFEQMVLIDSGGFTKESLSVPSEMIDPAVTGPEDQQVTGIIAPITENRLWSGPLAAPVDPINATCIKDWYGRRRSFNGSDYNYFHSGLDYGICSVAHPFDIYAAAPGTVVFAGPLTVRGNATFIDHGWGVYTAYYHQKEIDVAVGQQVQAGQLIGLIGDTGRVTGPHLHWEVWVGGVQVNPVDWLNKTYP